MTILAGLKVLAGGDEPRVFLLKGPGQPPFSFKVTIVPPTGSKAAECLFTCGDFPKERAQEMMQQILPSHRQEYEWSATASPDCDTAVTVEDESTKRVYLLSGSHGINALFIQCIGIAR